MEEHSGVSLIHQGSDLSSNEVRNFDQSHAELLINSHVMKICAEYHRFFPDTTLL